MRGPRPASPQPTRCAPALLLFLHCLSSLPLLTRAVCKAQPSRTPPLPLPGSPEAPPPQVSTSLVPNDHILHSGIFHLTPQKDYKLLRGGAVSYPQRPNLQGPRRTTAFTRSWIVPSLFPPSSTCPSRFYPPNPRAEEIRNTLNTDATTMRLRHVLYAGYWGCPGEWPQTQSPCFSGSQSRGEGRDLWNTYKHESIPASL